MADPNDIDALRAENERLRTAMRELAAEVERHDAHNKARYLRPRCWWDFEPELSKAKSVLAGASGAGVRTGAEE